MVKKITHIGGVGGNTFNYSPVQMLEATVKEIKAGKLNPSNCLIIMNVENEEADSTHIRKAQLDDDTAIGMMEKMKFLLLVDRYI